MSILVSLAAEWKGTKAFKKAEKDVFNLEKSFKNLSKTIGVSLSATAIVSFSKRAVTAFAEDEAAAIRLNNALKNLGLGFAGTQVEAFVASLEKGAVVADDQLRPALQTLLTTTGSLAKSQEILAMAVDVSRGSGIDLLTVSKDLGNAYVGNTRGLRKYYLGLSQAELKTADFAQVQGLLNKQFSGANAAYLDTTAGKLEAIGIAAGNAAETIGGSLVDAFDKLAGKSGGQGLAGFIDNFAAGIDVIIGEVTDFINFTKFTFDPKNWGMSGSEREAAYKRLLQDQINAAARPYDPANNAVTGYQRDRAAIIKAEKDAAKRAKALLDAQKKNTAELKKQSLAKKQSLLQDVEAANIVAALQGKITAEERLRLELQLALLVGNEDQAKKLSDRLADAIDSTGNLKRYINELPDAPNPFKGWDEWLKNFKANLTGVIGMQPNAGTPPAGIPSPSNVVPILPPNGAPEKAPWGTDRYGAPATINVQIDGKTIASALLDQSMSGNQAYLNRRTGGFE